MNLGRILGVASRFQDLTERRGTDRPGGETMKYRICALATAAAVAMGCSGQTSSDKSSPVQAPSPTGTPLPSATPSALEWDPQVKIISEELVSARKDGRFSHQALSAKVNGPAFVYLALSSDDPEIVSGAFQGIEKTYNPNQEYDSANLSDSRVYEAVLRGLNSDDRSVLYYALKAAPDSLGKTPDPKVMSKLIELADRAPEIGARIEAINALYTADGYDKNPQVLDVFIKAMGDESALASTALFRRSHGFTKSEKAESIKAAAERLLTHEDPGVRGRAVELAWDFHSGDGDWAVKTLGPMLKDPSAFVCSRAAAALGASKDLRAVDDLVPLLDDTRKNTYDIEYEDLLGRRSTIHHDGSAWSRVDDAALSALRSLTYSLPENERFVYEKIDPKNVEADIASCVKKAKAWYGEGHWKRSLKKESQ